ncbi:MAG: helix-turn-helix transcriptional regulator [Clostridia bacterium]|jgi:transcriptional regulator with XRE-family HTH domain|nr:helix-turn-helix transcriptional regulator [Clostridia bacterium]
MELDTLAVTIGKNITRLRRIANLTQLELAEKLNYSDKSVSKWEQGNGVPDVRILVQLADLFQVTVDDLVREHDESKQIVPRNARKLRRLIIILCSVGLCWLVAVAAFVFIGIAAPSLRYLWLSFLYAVPASAIVVLVFSCVWQNKTVRIISMSVMIWSILACIFTTAYVCGLRQNMWLIFLLGIPLQILALVFFVWWKRIRLFKHKD